MALFANLQNDLRRVQNGLARFDDHPVFELANAAGQVPSAVGVFFPPTLGALNGMTNGQVNALMAHYGIPAVAAGAGTVHSRRCMAVGVFLGVRQ